MLAIERRGGEKPLRVKETQGTWMGGELSHQCATLAPQNDTSTTTKQQHTLLGTLQ